MTFAVCLSTCTFTVRMSTPRSPPTLTNPERLAEFQTDNVAIQTNQYGDVCVDRGTDSGRDQRYDRYSDKKVLHRVKLYAKVQ